MVSQKLLSLMFLSLHLSSLSYDNDGDERDELRKSAVLVRRQVRPSGGERRRGEDKTTIHARDSEDASGTTRPAISFGSSAAAAFAFPCMDA